MSNKYICFDTESAQGRLKGTYVEELIEISILNGNKENIFYHRFKPSKLKRWDTSIHHITPAMLKDAPEASDYCAEMQRIFNSAAYIIGFSLIDDFKALKKAGIKNTESMPYIELRHLYWYCIGRHENTSFYSGPGLSQCAMNLNVFVDEDAVHSADGDTRVTLELFYALMRLFMKQEGLSEELPPIESEEFELLVQRMLKRIEEAKFEFDKEMAQGFILVVPVDGTYRFISSKSSERDDCTPILTIPVNARRKAAYELETMFGKKRVLNSKLFKLTATDIERIKCYQNEFDNQERLYEKLIGLQRANAIVKR